jgi:HSP20 family molecular chaperone IbpA
MTALTTNFRQAYRPGLLGRTVFDDVFDNFFTDFPQHLKRSTQGYPVADIYTAEDGSTVMEFALAGFNREDLSIEVQPGKRSITVSAATGIDSETETSRRIAKRNFQKTYINYDDNLDLSNLSASFENGLLTVTVPTQPDVKPLKIDIK